MTDDLVRVFGGVEIRQRAGDGYLNATAMCQANGKLWADYQRLAGTSAYLEALSESMGIPIDSVVESRPGQPSRGGGTWVHPDVAIHLAQWINPKFAVQVSQWVRELLTKGHTSIRADRDEGDDELDMLVVAIKRLKEVRTAQREAERKLAEVERTARQAGVVARAALDQGRNNHGYVTVLGYCRLTNRDITEDAARKIGKKASAILRKRGLSRGDQRSERYGKVGSYPESVLAEVFGDTPPALT